MPCIELAIHAWKYNQIWLLQISRRRSLGGGNAQLIWGQDVVALYCRQHGNRAHSKWFEDCKTEVSWIWMSHPWTQEGLNALQVLGKQESTFLLSEQMKAMGRGTIELMMNGYISLGPTSEGSSSIISSEGNGWFCLSPGFQPGFGGSTCRMPCRSVPD